MATSSREIGGTSKAVATALGVTSGCSPLLHLLISENRSARQHPGEP